MQRPAGRGQLRGPRSTSLHSALWRLALAAAAWVLAAAAIGRAAAGAARSELAHERFRRRAALASPTEAPPEQPPGAQAEALEAGLFSRLLDGPDRPLLVEPVYIGELMVNARGGVRTRGAARYAGLLDLGLTADLSGLGWPLPGRFHLLAQNTHGRGLTDAFVGDAQVLSNIDALEPIMQVSEYWWELPLHGESLVVRLGKQDVNTEFRVIDVAQHFAQSSFGLSPTLGVPTFPDPSAAAVVLAQLTEGLRLKLGLWDAVPQGGNWGFSGAGVTLTIGELDFDYALLGGRLPGQLSVGLGYSSAGKHPPGERRPQAWDVHVDFEQVVWREGGADASDGQGLAVFAHYGSSYGKRLVEFPEFFGAGFVYHGLLPGREEDNVGVGIARARLNRSVFLGPRETAIEAYYRVQLTSRLAVQPDLQYIASPSGGRRDALVVGVRFEAAP